MTKAKINDSELIKDIKLIKKEYKAGRLSVRQAKSAISIEVANYLRGL